MLKTEPLFSHISQHSVPVSVLGLMMENNPACY
jgi:hypothetical protein